MRTITKGIVIWAAGLLPCFTALADGTGLATDADRVPWGSLHGRIAYAVAAGWRSDFSFTDRPKTGPLSIMGDLYFGAASNRNKSQFSGFHATSGIVVGARNTLWATPGAAPASGLLSIDRHLFGQVPAPGGSAFEGNADSATLPYIGFGYSSLAMRSGWSFSADLGLVSLNPGNAVRLGRVFLGNQGLDDVVRDMRLSPLLQLGVSYSF